MVDIKKSSLLNTEVSNEVDTHKEISQFFCSALKNAAKPNNNKIVIKWDLENQDYSLADYDIASPGMKKILSYEDIQEILHELKTKTKYYDISEIGTIDITCILISLFTCLAATISCCLIFCLCTIGFTHVIGLSFLAGVIQFTMAIVLAMYAFHVNRLQKRIKDIRQTIKQWNNLKFNQLGINVKVGKYGAWLEFDRTTGGKYVVETSILVDPRNETSVKSMDDSSESDKHIDGTSYETPIWPDMKGEFQQQNYGTNNSIDNYKTNDLIAGDNYATSDFLHSPRIDDNGIDYTFDLDRSHKRKSISDKQHALGNFDTNLSTCRSNKRRISNEIQEDHFLETRLAYILKKMEDAQKDFKISDNLSNDLIYGFYCIDRDVDYQPFQVNWLGFKTHIKDKAEKKPFQINNLKISLDFKISGSGSDEQYGNYMIHGKIDSSAIMFQTILFDGKKTVLNGTYNKGKIDGKWVLYDQVDAQLDNGTFGLEPKLAKFSGFYNKGEMRYDINLDQFIDDHEVFGIGEDHVGVFVIRGERNEDIIGFNQRYVLQDDSKNECLYLGKCILDGLDKIVGINGKWQIETINNGVFELKMD